MVKLFQKLVAWFQRKTDKLAPVELNETPVLKNDPSPKYQGIVALVVGHNENEQGAVNYLKESEWVFSSRILRKAQKKLTDRGWVSYVIFRPSGKNYAAQVRAVVKQCVELGVTHAILSHFNSAVKGARGCEFLVPKSSTTIDNNMADMATDLIHERFGIKQRHNDGVYEVDESHRGSGMMFGLLNVGIYSTLAEPCFAGYKTEESSQIFENEDAYVDILVEVAEACCNGTIDNYDLGK